MTGRAAIQTLIAAVMLVIGRVAGPGEGGSVLQLVLVLLLVVAGIVEAMRGVRSASRAVRGGGDVATGPLVICAFLVLWGLVIVAGTLGRFWGWD